MRWSNWQCSIRRKQLWIGFSLARDVVQDSTSFFCFCSTFQSVVAAVLCCHVAACSTNKDMLKCAWYSLQTANWKWSVICLKQSCKQTVKQWRWHRGLLILLHVWHDPHLQMLIPRIQRPLSSSSQRAQDAVFYSIHCRAQLPYPSSCCKTPDPASLATVDLDSAQTLLHVCAFMMPRLLFDRDGSMMSPGLTAHFRHSIFPR